MLVWIINLVVFIACVITTMFLYMVYRYLIDIKIKKQETVLKRIFRYLVAIALAISTVTAGISIVNFNSKNELIQAGRFIDSVQNSVDERGVLLFESNGYRIFVMTNEWYEQHVQGNDQ